MDATSYLQDELRKTEKSIRTMLIATVVVVVVMFAYFAWMKAELAEVLTPDSVAEFLVNQTRSAMPTITESLQANIKDQAPNLVHYVVQQGVEKVLPLAGDTFRTTLEEHSRSLNAIGGDKALAALEASLRSYKASKDRPKKEDAAALTASLGKHIEAQLPMQLDVVAKDSIKAHLDKSGETLKHINQELVSMAQRPTAGDREGELGKRLITTWWSFLDRGRPQLPNQQVDLAKKPAK